MLTIDELNEDEREEYWRRVERHARLMRAQLLRTQRLRTELLDAGVDPAVQADILDKMAALRQSRSEPQPTPDAIRSREGLPG